MQCRTDMFCSSGGVESTFEACCSNRLDPPGIAYTIDGGEGCRACPIGMYHNSIIFYIARILVLSCQVPLQYSSCYITSCWNKSHSFGISE